MNLWLVTESAYYLHYFYDAFILKCLVVWYLKELAETKRKN